eukprot:NODE_2306_length_1216_cov_87.790634_g2193_i0.p1 GENE.NODE_2306_length_1216_cov_87.790634_g2193_i0~~NODE_2306_length_1216_cov_87.790634_g2193_i0.p1  ORF type:complete len:366 (-),score=81.08 NODE_2306_length_1216_cov_87.790634_g2193_i0:66-1163(-)
MRSIQLPLRNVGRGFYNQAEPAIFATLTHGKPAPWRLEKQVPPNPRVSKWNWVPEHIPTPEEYEQHPKVITIFGGSGYLGQHTIQALLQSPEVDTIRVATRFPEKYAQTIPTELRGKVVAEFVNITDQHNVLSACEGSQGLINMMGISHECELSYYEAHVQSAKWIAHSANTVMASRVLHISSLSSGLDSISRYAETKFRGEDAALASFPWTTILRFGPLFGNGTPHAKKFLRAARFAPFYPCVARHTQVQPTHVEDAAFAIATAMGNVHTRQLQYDLGGPKVYTHSELVNEVLRKGRLTRPVVPVPGVVGDAIISILQWLPDPIATRDLVNLLRSHHVSNHSKMRSWMEFAPARKLKALADTDL